MSVLFYVATYHVLAFSTPARAKPERESSPSILSFAQYKRQSFIHTVLRPRPWLRRGGLCATHRSVASLQQRVRRRHERRFAIAADKRQIGFPQAFASQLGQVYFIRRLRFVSSPLSMSRTASAISPQASLKPSDTSAAQAVANASPAI